MVSTGGTYHLGIDLGTTYAAAGILRDGRPEVVTLGDRAPVVPSVLFFKDDGEVLTGEPANRRGLIDPSRVVREFKRRVGDSTPLVVGQTPYSADALLAKLLRFVYDSVVERQGSRPQSVAITHPANWGDYKIDVLRQAIRMADIGEVETLTEPVAAAIHYAASERLDPGQSVAVYDLGGGTFDAAVLRKVNGDFEVLGDVEGIERLGGIDLDEAVFQHALRWCESAFDELDADDPTTVQALARLRQECVAAKEALSADTDVAIPVVLPNLQTEVRLTRAEFEAMIRPLLQQTVEALHRSIRSADVEIDDLAAVLLVGGSSQIPLIAEMLAADLGRPIAVDQHPKHTVALGAAIAAGRDSLAPEPQVAGYSHVESDGDDRLAVGAPPAAVGLAADSASTVSLPITQPAMEPILAREPTVPSAPMTPTTPIVPTVQRGYEPTEVHHQVDQFRAPQPSSGNGGGSRRLLVAGLVVVLLVLVGGAAWAVTGNGSDPEDSDQIVAQDETGSTTTEPGGATTADPASSVAVDQSTVVESTTSTVEDTTTTSEATTTVTEDSTTTVADGLSATISDIAIDGGRYVVSYTTSFQPLISSDPASHHLHFFFDTVPIAEAGAPGGGPWILYDGPAPFTQYGPGDRPSGAEQMCVTVATHTHAVDNPAVYHCMALPDS